VRVVIADDSVLLREGVARLLAEAGFEVVGQAGDADELLHEVADKCPDVAIVDIRMPPTHTDEGLRAARELRSRYPTLGVLVLSQYVRPSYAFELLADDARGVGYLLKDRVSDVRDLADAVNRVGDGGSVLDPSVVSQLVGRRRQGHDPIDDLTERERQVLALIAEGRSNRAIAERLVISEKTAGVHVSHIFAKLDVHDRRVAATRAYQLGLTGPPPERGA
jgi:DNA-binding NarL/FixJ family response regulator